MKRIAWLLPIALLLPTTRLVALSTGPQNCVPTPVSLGVISKFHAQLARDAHLGWVRIDFRWREINPSPNFWDFAAMDNVVNAARSRGLNILGILSTAPQWAGGGPHGNTPPANTSYWQEFVRRVAQRYDGDVVAYEVWNEPNLQNQGEGIGWDRPISQSPRYVDYLRIAAQQIRAQAPGTLVVGPVVSSEPDSRTSQILRQIENTGSSQYLDVLSFHANGNNRSVSQIAGWINGHLNKIVADNPTNRYKPIWITEMGWDSGSIGEAAQRSRTQQIIRSMRGDPGFAPFGGFPICGGWSEWNITHAFLFTILDGQGETAGIYRANETPKQIVTSYLTSKPFPAVDRDPSQNVPFSVSCPSRTCTFSSTPGVILPSLWDFGDGTSTTTSGHQVSHTFPRSGWFFVKHIQATGGFVQLVDVP